ncbi:hypothetical protein [Aquamicrobium sp. LC103]|uniref:hypothetical protein n=1 Tax=Aquamicrobium sp. LC103 TaxID=1120658 RepID=UPI00063EB0FF|nr:hypothetical protein [Aquamicrobium sp. LC103]
MQQKRKRRGGSVSSIDRRRTNLQAIADILEEARKLAADADELMLEYLIDMAISEAKEAAIRSK